MALRCPRICQWLSENLSKSLIIKDETDYDLEVLRMKILLAMIDINR
jgi:hypothetical protein